MKKSLYTYPEYCRLIRDCEGWNEVEAIAYCVKDDEKNFDLVLYKLLSKKLGEKAATLTLNNN